MPVIWLLLLAAGGYTTYKVFSTASDSDAGGLSGPHPSDLANLFAVSDVEAAFAKKSPYERFTNGHVDCNNVLRLFTYEETKVADLKYLASVPPTANARIGAIMSKVRAFGPPPPSTPPVSPSSLIEAMARSSYNYLQGVADSIVTSYADVKRYPFMAAALAVSEEEIKRQAGTIMGLRAANASPYQFVESAAAEIAPVASVISAVVSGYKEHGSVGALANAMVAVGSSVPAVGVLVSVGVALASKSFDEQIASDHEKCRQMNDQIGAVYKTTLDMGEPVPWHILEGDTLKCPDYTWGEAHSYHDTPAQESALAALKINYDLLNGKFMDGVYRDAIKRWWLVSQTFMSDPRIQAIFAALGRTYFSPSDEQVLLVAAPIAASEGLDIEDFAKRLWCRSAGWCTSNQKLWDRRYITTRRFIAKGKCRGYDYWHMRPGSCDPDVYETTTSCDSSVENTSTLQWAILAIDAFQLAAELKGRVPPTSVLGDPASLAHIKVTKPVAIVERPDLTTHLPTTKGPKAPKIDLSILNLKG